MGAERETATPTIVRPDVIQCKKRVVADPADPLEVEADRVADQVTRPQPAPCPCMLTGQRCKKCGEELHMRSAGGPPPVREAPDAVERLSGRGSALPGSVRNEFEPRLGMSLAGVRIHTDPAASRLASTLDALAFTVGQDVVFAPGQWAPESTEGRRLLAHELAHVRQQQAGSDLLQRNGDGGAPAQQSSKSVTLDDGTHLQDNDEQLRELVRDRIKQKGFDAGDKLVTQIESEISVRLPSAGTEAGEGTEERRYFKDKLRPIVDAVNIEVSDFIQAFETDARNVLYKMLDDSKQRVEAELIRYGIKVDYVDPPGGDDQCAGAEGCGPGTDQVAVYSMENESPSAKSLSAAAQILLARRQKLDSDRAERDRRVHNRCHEDECFEVFDEGYEQFKKAAEDGEKAYKKLNEQFKSEYPALGAFSDLDQEPSGLATLAVGPGPGMAAAIAAQSNERLKNITETREGIQSGEGSVWKLQNILDLTKAAKGYEEGGFEAALVAHKFDAVNSSWVEIALAAVSLVFALLAPVTGGLSLIVTAAISTGIAAEHLNEYLLEKAMSGTDFDKARSITTEPSLFWLALDIAGAVLDIIPAVGVAAKIAKAKGLLGALRPAVIAAEAAKTEEELAQAVQKISEAASTAEKNGDNLAREVIEHVKANRAGGTPSAALGATEDEAKALKAAAEYGDQLVKEKGVLEEIDTAAGKIKITNNGWVFSCASPCQMLREKYAKALALSPGLEGEIAKLEDVSRRAAAATDEAAARELKAEARQRLRSVEAKLRDVPTAERVAELGRLEEVAKSLQGAHPMLSEVSSKGIERILALRPQVESMKGQLLEELLNARMANPEKLAASAGEKAVAAAEKAGSKLEFIPGHKIRDANGRLISDGIVGYREGDKFRIVQIFESKAGSSSAEGLAKTTSRMTRADWKELAAEAIDELLAKRKLPNTPANRDMLRKTAKEELKAIRDEIVKEEAGQVRRTIERLVPNDEAPATRIFIDGEPLDIVAGGKSTKVVGVVPSNVDVKELEKGLAKEGLSFETLQDPRSQEQLLEAAKSLLAEAEKQGI